MEIVNKIGVVLFLLLVSACGEAGDIINDILGGDVGGSGQCAGATETGSCVRIEKIVPQYSAKDSSDVDVARDICNLFEVQKTPGTEPKLETFTDHSAKLTITNRPMPGVDDRDISDITLERYQIQYRNNRCPVGACPRISDLLVSPGETFVVRVDGSIEITLPFVPLSSKFEYENSGGPLLDFPSYTATYTLTGTDSFKNPVAVSGSTEFTIGNYDYCAS